MIWLLIVVIVVVGYFIVRAINRPQDDITWCNNFDRMHVEIKEILCQNIYKFARKGYSLQDIAHNASSGLNETRVAYVLNSDFYKNLEKRGALGQYPYND
ncbi:hypothetical protein M1512_03855 [Patescibacteria group bacterium]|jgi:hypothetical protein|nr:hypothetical protein [Patescibacteria group bacterium]